MTRDVVWCVLEDGPYAGFVTEVGGNDRELTIQERGKGATVYRRSRWAPTPKGHRIVLFRYEKTLVI